MSSQRVTIQIHVGIEAKTRRKRRDKTGIRTNVKVSTGADTVDKPLATHIRLRA